MGVYVLAVLALLAAFAVGLLAGVYILAPRAGKALSAAKLGGVTRRLMISTLRCALVWVFLSYAIAIYSTVRLGVVYTMAELSEPAIYALLGVNLTKVLENVFEHNNGKVFGVSRTVEPSGPDGADV